MLDVPRQGMVASQCRGHVEPSAVQRLVLGRTVPRSSAMGTVKRAHAGRHAQRRQRERHERPSTRGDDAVASLTWPAASDAPARASAARRFVRVHRSRAHRSHVRFVRFVRRRTRAHRHHAGARDCRPRALGVTDPRVRFFRGLARDVSKISRHARGPGRRAARRGRDKISKSARYDSRNENEKNDTTVDRARVTSCSTLSRHCLDTVEHDDGWKKKMTRCATTGRVELHASRPRAPSGSASSPPFAHDVVAARAQFVYVFHANQRHGAFRLARQEIKRAFDASNAAGGETV